LGFCHGKEILLGGVHGLEGFYPLPNAIVFDLAIMEGSIEACLENAQDSVGR
jgi:hypothetical protein